MNSLTTARVGPHAEAPAFSKAAGGNSNWHNHSVKPFGVLLKFGDLLKSHNLKDPIVLWKGSM